MDKSLEGTVFPHEPRKTIHVCKLCQVRKGHPGKLFSFFIDRWTFYRLGKIYKAEIGPLTEDGRIAGKGRSYANRPGFHSCEFPSAPHIGGRTGKSKGCDYRKDDEVWVLCEVPADVDWQAEALSRAVTNRDGSVRASSAEIRDEIPENGFYRYKTNPNANQSWIISGGVKFLRMLEDREVEEMSAKAGLSDLPRLKPFNPEEWGFPSFAEQRKNCGTTRHPKRSLSMRL